MTKSNLRENHQRSSLKNITDFIFNNTRPLTLITGSFFICCWTIVRFFIKSSNFDLVGQQVLARQWMQGFHSGAIVGPTNHILKIIFIYIPMNLLPGSARIKLIIMTLLINVITYILLILILEKLWLEFYPKISKSFYIVALWMALIAGSMYWISFSNSRNIEIVGGL